MCPINNWLLRFLSCTFLCMIVSFGIKPASAVQVPTLGDCFELGDIFEPTQAKDYNCDGKTSNLNYTIYAGDLSLSGYGICSTDGAPTYNVGDIGNPASTTGVNCWCTLDGYSITGAGQGGSGNLANAVLINTDYKNSSDCNAQCGCECAGRVADASIAIQLYGLKDINNQFCTCPPLADFYNKYDCSNMRIDVASNSGSNWTISFRDGTSVTGTSLCSITDGIYPRTPGVPNETQSGDYCWCRATSFNDGTNTTNATDSSWYFAEPISHCSTNDCAHVCSGAIAEPIGNGNCTFLENLSFCPEETSCITLNTIFPKPGKPSDASYQSGTTTFTLTYNEGTVYGTGMCSATIASNAGDTNPSPSTTPGDYCWCNLTGYDTGSGTVSGSLSNWYYETSLNPCADDKCTQACSKGKIVDMYLDTLFADDFCEGEGGGTGGGGGNVQTYTVTYQCGSAGGTAPTDPHSPYNSGATVTTLTNTCNIPSGQVFLGWSCNNIAVAEGGAFTINANTTCTAQYMTPVFAVSTTSGVSSFNFSLSARGTFYVDCGNGGTLSGNGVSGNTITRSGTTQETYTCTWGSTGTQTIQFAGTATGYNSNVNIAAISFYAGSNTNAAKVASISGKLSVIFPYISGNQPTGAQPRFSETFRGTSITSIPSTLFQNYTAAATNMFSNTFNGCTSLTSAGIPSNLFFQNVSSVSGASNLFDSTFNGCTGLTSIPTGLFAKVTSPAIWMFSNTFRNCTSLTSAGIPSNLFFPNASSVSGTERLFHSTFYGCTSLTSIPTGLFAKVTSSAQGMFGGTFSGCTGLTSAGIPSNLFFPNASSVSGASQMFIATFYGCTGLTSIPSDLFAKVTSPVSNMFENTFKDCTNLGCENTGCSTGTGYIPPSTFAGLIANDSTKTTNMWSYAFDNTKLVTTCPTGTTQYTTGYEGNTNGTTWNGKLSCVQQTPPTVTYSCGDGTGNPPTDSNSPYTHGATVTTLANTCTAPSGATFQGWSCNGTILAVGDTFTIFADTTCTAQYRTFALTTTYLPANDSFYFALTPSGTFTVNCGDGGTLSSTTSPTDVSGNTITRSGTTLQIYACTWGSAGSHTISFNGTATGYASSGDSTARSAIRFYNGSNTNANDTVKRANAAKIASISGDLSAMFPYISGNNPDGAQPRFYGTFLRASNLASIPATLFQNYTSTSEHMFSNTFQECTSLTSIPANLFFPNASSVSGRLSMFYGTFNGCTSLTSIPTGLFAKVTSPAQSLFNRTFTHCSGLSSLPQNLFFPNITTSVSGTQNLFEATFYGCTGLTSIPSNLFFPNATSVSGATRMFIQTFENCSGLTSLPTGLFAKVTSGAERIFYSTFQDCTSLTSIPSNLFFPNVTSVSGATDMFGYTFQNCSSLTSIPTGLFAKVTSSTNNMFFGTFYGCTSLTTIPSNLFFPNAQSVSGAGYMFAYTFYGCTSLTSIPSGLFAKITSSAGFLFTYTFARCTSLTSDGIPSNLFFPNASSVYGNTHLFNYTFEGCTSLTSIPENLFAKVTSPTTDLGYQAGNMFNSTFQDCTNLGCETAGCSTGTGYIPPSTFAGLIANDSTKTTNMWGNTFNNTKLVTTCPTGTIQYITGYEGNTDGTTWNGKVSCETAPQRTLTYACGDGTGNPPTDSNSPYTHGTSVTTLANTCTPPSGKIFQEWSCNGSSVAAGGTFTINADTTCTAQYSTPKFTLTTTSGVSSLQFSLSAAGTFTVYCGNGGTLSGNGVSGNTITRSGTTEEIYTCTWGSAGTHTIYFDGTATGYNSNAQTAAISFYTGSNNSAKAANAAKVASISGNLSAVFPYISGNAPDGAQPRFNFTFRDATHLTSIPATLFQNYTTASSHMFHGTFYECTSLTSAGIPSNLFFPNATSVSGASYMFDFTFMGCTSLTTIPTGLFAKVTSSAQNLFGGTFYGCTSLTSAGIPSNLFFPNASSVSGSRSMFASTFYGCTSLTTIPTGLFAKVTSSAHGLFTATFKGCTSLTSAGIPSNLFFPNASSVSGESFMFNGTFEGCTSLTTIPTGLFAKVTSGADYMFAATFKECTSLTSNGIPSNLFFPNASSVSGADYMFEYAFSGCTSLTSIPTGLFDKVTSGAEYLFHGTFYGCTSLTSAGIPSNLFFPNTSSVSGARYMFFSTFYGCTSLTTIPTGLFDKVTSGARYMFSSAFEGCTSLTSIPENLFANVTSPAKDMFQRTFYGCTNLGCETAGCSTGTGYIPPSTFAGLIANDSTKTTSMWSNAFYNTKLVTTCPTGTVQYTTGYEGNTDGTTWNGKVSCEPKLTLTYACGDGTGNPPTDSNSPYTSGTSVTTLANTCTPPSGKIFQAWSCNNTLVAAGGTFTINADTTCTAQYSSFTLTTTSGVSSFNFSLSAVGTFTVYCGDGGTLSGNGASGNTITRTSGGIKTYTCTWSSAGAHTIGFDGTATEYYSNDATISFHAGLSDSDKDDNAAKIASISGNLSAMFPYLSGNAPDGTQPRFSSTFKKATGLTSIPSTLFQNYTTASTHMFYSTFRDCTSLTSIPSNLFFPNASSVSGAVNMFRETFSGCTSLTSIPTGLFAKVTSGAQYLFLSTFGHCTSLTSAGIPSNLFFPNTSSVSGAQNMFYGTFAECTSLTSIPTGLFAKVTSSAPSLFGSTFSGCTSLTSAGIPSNLFFPNAQSVSGASSMFYNTFNGCTGLISIPTDLFAKIISPANNMFQRTFNGCTNLGCATSGCSTGTGWIPPSTFAGLIANDSTKTTSMWDMTFTDTKLVTTCPSNRSQYITGYEGNTNGTTWNGKVSCGDCAAGYYANNNECTQCPSEYPSSPNNNTGDITSCYRSCTTNDVANSTAVSGDYHSGGSNNCAATACAANTYLNNGACTGCPTAYPNSAAGSTSINDCYVTLSAGYEVASAGAGKTACAGGKYNTSTANIYYGGNVSGRDTTNTCSNITAGYYCAGGAKTATPSSTSDSVTGAACGNCASANGANGRMQYSDAGAASCSECPAVTGTLTSRMTSYHGWWSNNIHNSIGGCAVNFTDDDPDSTNVVWCMYSTTDSGYGGTNSYCQTAQPTACAAGKYSTIQSTNEWVNAGYAQCYGVDCMKGKVCTDTTAGYYSADGALTQTGCGDGSYSSAGAASCTACTTTSGWATHTTSTTATAYSACYQTRTPSGCASGNTKRTASSISGTTITYGSETVENALSASGGHKVSGTTCPECGDGSYYAGGTATSCTACTTTSGWATHTTSTTATAYSACYQTRTPSGCASGNTKRTASSISGTTITYGTETVENALSASGGHKVSGITCPECGDGSYYAGGTATSCTACPTRTDSTWTVHTTSTTASAYSACYETKPASSVSSYCHSGQLSRTADNANSWGTATSTLTAKQGSIITGTGNNTTCSQCTGATYMASADGHSNTACTSCPTPNDHKRTTFPSNYYGGNAVESSNAVSKTGATAITQCEVQNWVTGTRGRLNEHATYNTTTEKYDVYMWHKWTGANAGYYLLTPDTCGSYAYYQDAAACESGSYCPGKATTECNSSNQSTVWTTTFGKESCSSLTGVSPTGGTYSSDGNRDAKTSCLYTAPSGKTISGCKTVTSQAVRYTSNNTWPASTYGVTANKGHIVLNNNQSNASCPECTSGTFMATDGNTATSCTACPTGYSGSDGGFDAQTDCYKSCSNTTVAHATPTSVAPNSAKVYYTGSAYPACTYNPSCDTGYTATNGANPVCNANCNMVTLNTNASSNCTSSVNKLYKKTDATGWYTDSNCSTAYTTSSDIVITCGSTSSKWKFRGYFTEQMTDVTSDSSNGTLLLNKNGASTTAGTNLTINAPTTIYAAYALECTSPNNGSCTYTINADNGSVDYTTSCSTGYTLGGNNSATPSCTANTNTITLNGNGATGGKIKNNAMTSGAVTFTCTTASSMSLPTWSATDSASTTSIVKTDSIFLGWSESSDCTTSSCVVNPTTCSTGAKTYYAVWSACSSATKGSNVATATYNGVESNQCKYTHVCNTGYYHTSHNIKIAGTASINCSACTNKPASNSHYTSGATSNSCSWLCDGGYYTSSSNTCSAVDTGYYSSNNENDRHACTDFRANTTTTGTTSASSSDCLCKAGMYLNSSNVCTDTTQGNYSGISNSQTACTTFRANTTTTGTGASSTSDCLCKAGMYLNSSNVCTDASAGYYSGISNSQSVCGAGKYSTGGATSCSNVNAGYFCSGGCTSATPNTTVGGANGTGSNGCISGQTCGLLSAGRYGSAGESTNQGTGAVSAGYFSSGGGTSATPTAAGNGCVTGQTCGTITAGYYCAGGGKTATPSSTSDSATGASCGACASPNFSNAGASSCTACSTLGYPTGFSSGTFSSTGSHNANTTCRFTASDKSKPSNCDTISKNAVAYSGSAWGTNFYTVTTVAGYYITANNNANPSCAAADNGYYVATTNATSQSQCPEGFRAGSDTVRDSAAKCYRNCAASDVGGSTAVTGKFYNRTTNPNQCSATACGSGTYLDNGACAGCPTAYPNSAAGTDTINNCYLTTTAGKYVTSANAGTGTQSNCTAGNFCPGNVTIYYGGTHGSSHLTYGGISSCPTGYPNSAASNSKQGQCYLTLTAGKKVASAGAGISNCDAGKYCTSTNNIYYNSDGGTTSYTGTECITGSYSAAGSSSCTPCAGGKKNTGTGNSSCNDDCTSIPNLATWETPSWNSNNNTVSNLCTVKTCQTCTNGTGAQGCASTITNNACVYTATCKSGYSTNGNTNTGTSATCNGSTCTCDANTISLIWYDEDGSTPASGVSTEAESCIYGQEITLPDNPTKPGYKFIGWTVM